MKLTQISQPDITTITSNHIEITHGITNEEWAEVLNYLNFMYQQVIEYEHNTWFIQFIRLAREISILAPENLPSYIFTTATKELIRKMLDRRDDINAKESIVADLCLLYHCGGDDWGYTLDSWTQKLDAVKRTNRAIGVASLAGFQHLRTAAELRIINPQSDEIVQLFRSPRWLELTRLDWQTSLVDKLATAYYIRVVSERWFKNIDLTEYRFDIEPAILVNNNRGINQFQTPAQEANDLIGLAVYLRIIQAPQIDIRQPRLGLPAYTSGIILPQLTSELIF